MKPRPMNAFAEKLREIEGRKNLPPAEELAAVTKNALRILTAEDGDVRPCARDGLSGGYVRAPKKIPSVIVPDLHGRVRFFLDILMSAPPALSSFFSLDPSVCVLDMLAAGKINLIFLGDGFHSESRGRTRWIKGYEAFLSGDILSRYMLAEMRENFSLMESVMLLKTAFPRYVHFLKGNHENIKNASGGGNLPFYKFADEGEMTKVFTETYYGAAFLDLYAEFELSLPVFVSGDRFLASHAEPLRFFSRDELINARLFPDVVKGLTWTDNGAADPDAVKEMLLQYQPECPDALYFGGHRPVREGYALRAEGRFVQIHNPLKEQVALVFPDSAFDFSSGFYSCGGGGSSTRPQ